MTLFYSPTTRGFYDDALHTTFPPDAIEIGRPLYEALLLGQSQGGQITMVGGAPTIVQPPQPTLEDLKTQLKAAVDRDAETYRLKYITAGVGQAMTYTQKADEAARYLAATEPVAADYPLLSAEVGITAQDIEGVANVVKTAFTEWQVVGALIEKSRLGGKAAIDAAENVDGVHRAFNSVAWPQAVSGQSGT